MLNTGSWFNKKKDVSYAVQGLYSGNYGWETVDMYPTWIDAIRKISKLDFVEPDIEHRIKKMEVEKGV